MADDAAFELVKAKVNLEERDEHLNEAMWTEMYIPSNVDNWSSMYSNNTTHLVDTCHC